MIKKLDELFPGEKGIIVKISGNPILRQRLLELGIREGKEIIRKIDAPMGDPISVQTMGTNLSFRRHIAKHIFVEVE
ncbi:MAG: FeoA family protein [Brevinematia bacterium]